MGVRGRGRRAATDVLATPSRPRRAQASRLAGGARRRRERRGGHGRRRRARRARGRLCPVPPTGRARGRRPDRGARAGRRDRPGVGGRHAADLSPCPCSCGSSAATPSGARTSACGRSPGSPRTSSTSCAGTLRAFNRGPAQVDQIERVADEYRRATMGTLRIAFLSGTVLELAATLGIALVAVTVGRLVEEASASRGLTVLVLAPELYLPSEPRGAVPRQRRRPRSRGAAPRPDRGRPDARSRRRPPAEAERGADPPRGRLVRISVPERARARHCRRRAGAGRDRRARRGYGERQDHDRISPPPPGGPHERSPARGGRPRHMRPVRVARADCGCRSGHALPGDGRREHQARRASADDDRMRRAAALAGADTFVASSRTVTTRWSATEDDHYRPARCSGSPLPAPSSAMRRSSSSTSRRRTSTRSAPSSWRGRRKAARRPHHPPARTGRARAPGRPDRHHRRRPHPGAGAGRGMRILRRLVGIAGIPRWRAALSVLLGALAVAFGVALMATAGYLVSRAAEQPPILSLTVTIVAVRFFGLARPLSRYLDRLVGHDLALRALGRIRARFYARLAAAPAQLETYRRGDLLERMIGDVDSLQGLYLGLGPPLVALAVGAAAGVTAAFLPQAAAVLALGLVVAGSRSRCSPAPSLARPPTAARRLGRAQRRACRACAVRPSSSRTAARTTSNAASALWTASPASRVATRSSGLGGTLLAACGLTVVGVLAVSVTAHDTGTSTACSSRRSRCSRSPRSTLSASARGRTGADGGRRVRAPAARAHRPRARGARPRTPIAAPTAPATVALEDVTVRYGSDEAPAPAASIYGSSRPQARARGPSGAGKTTVTHLLFRFLDPERGRVTIAGRDLREYRQEDVRRMFALAGQGAHLFASTIRENLRLARPAADDDALWSALRRAQVADWVHSLPDGLDTFVGEEGDGLSGGQRQRLVLARALLATLLCGPRRAHLPPRPRDGSVSDERRPRREPREDRAPDHAPLGGARPHRRGRHARRWCDRRPPERRWRVIPTGGRSEAGDDLASAAHAAWGA